jgi:hypothetical protein
MIHCLISEGERFHLVQDPAPVRPVAAGRPDDPALAQKAEKTETKTTETKDDDSKRPPLPADRTITQSARIGGRVVTYKATVGTIPVRDDKGKEIGQVVYTAYTVPGGDVRRPVTFAFNGGPGASSVYLNMGAVGPKRVQFGAQGDARPTRRSRPTIRTAGWTSPTWSSSIRSAPASAAAWWTRRRPRSLLRQRPGHQISVQGRL